MEIQCNGNLSVVVVSVHLNIGSGKLNSDGGYTALGCSVHLHNLGKRQLARGGAASSFQRAVQETNRENPLQNQLAAHHFCLRHADGHAAGQNFRSAFPARRQVQLIGKCKIFFCDMCQCGGMLHLPPFFNAQGRVCLGVGTKFRLHPSISGEASDKPAASKHLAGIQRAGFQKLWLGVRHQKHTLRHGLGVRLSGKGHCKVQCANATLPIRGIEHRHPHGAGNFRLSVPQLSAVEIDFALRVDDAGNVGAVIRHNCLRRFLLRQHQLPAHVIGVKASFF